MFARPVSTVALASIVVCVLASMDVIPVFGQWTPEKRGSDNIEVVAHIPLGAWLSVSDV